MTLVTATVKNKTTVTASTNSVTIGGADATVQLNGSTIGTVASGATGDFPVTQDGSPVGSWNGSAWIIPPDSGGATLSVSINDSTPTYLQDVTVTATPTGMSPTSYTFYLPNIDGTFNEVTQISNVYVWTCGLDGLGTITVTATDGSIESTSTADVTATWTIGKAIDLNGTTQSVETINKEWYNIVSSQRSVWSFWFNADNLANDPVIFSGDAFGFIQIKPTGIRVFAQHLRQKTFTFSFVAGTKYYVVVNKTNVGDNTDVYVNGTQLTTTTGTAGDHTAIDEKYYISSYLGGSGFEFNGKIAQISFIKGHYATSSQILAQYNSGAGRHPYRLLERNPFWNINFNDNVLDYGTSGFDCQLINSPSYVTF